MLNEAEEMKSNKEVPRQINRLTEVLDELDANARSLEASLQSVLKPSPLREEEEQRLKDDELVPLADLIRQKVFHAIDLKNRIVSLNDRIEL